MSETLLPTHPLLLGIDTGGTFTDFVLFDGQRLRVHKVLSTPDAPERAILQGIRELGIDSGQHRLRIVHGSTVATNAVLEGKGVRTAFITNRGLGDLLTIGRQARRSLYDLQPSPQEPPVPKSLCLETGGRLGANGETVEPLSDADLAELRARVEALAPRAVAINLLFSFLDATGERAIEAILPEDIFVSRSSDVLPEYREYERGMATWLNAYIGPLVDGYLVRLRAGVTPAPVAVMQSSGDTVDAAHAGRYGVHLLLSGPAGGLTGVQFVAASAGRGRCLSFDMGGTSTDVAMIDGKLRLTSEGRIGDYPVAVPMVDMHTIGAGGGSIARLDAGGLLQVGPESAGASPGPACYGQGGVEPTVTDANLVLGRLQTRAFLGGRMRLDPDAARAALERIAMPLGLSVEEAAEGIVRIANEHMARALRVISVQRGVDPRTFTLACFGGAGGMHVCALAEALGMNEALVPIHAGVLSALGMLAATPGRQLSRTQIGLIGEIAEQLPDAFKALAEQGRAALRDEGHDPDALAVTNSLDMRYFGQSYTLNVPWRDDAQTAARAFHEAHAKRYGHALEEPVEVVNLRVSVQAEAPRFTLDAHKAMRATGVGEVEVFGCASPVPVYRREQLAAGIALTGPAVITETVSTTWLAPDWKARIDRVGNLLLTRVV
ncbi:MAG: hydantoinase/oxoprolinase family protein [Gammaproteobacteria bacterium]|nr:hydantoinase/oxoprolinase family protein [Gammaproteobacteria bacterium]MCP5137991.1 hydantoinase/oxoprolinase family protein [Gammaproteobacteria bacterium]